MLSSHYYYILLLFRRRTDHNSLLSTGQAKQQQNKTHEEQTMFTEHFNPATGFSGGEWWIQHRTIVDVALVRQSELSNH